MSNLIEWKTASQVIEILRSQNALVSGMTVAEAAAALGFTKTASGLYIKTIITTAAQSVAGASATSVAAAAASTTATTTATNLVLLEGGVGGTATVGGLASAALPVAAVIAAAAGGYLIGNEIYEQNPAILDGILLPLFNFVTGNNLTPEDMYEYDHPTVPIIFDVDGNTYMDSGAVNAAKSYIDSQCIDILPTGVTKYNLPAPPGTYQQWGGEIKQSPLPLLDYPYQLMYAKSALSTEYYLIMSTEKIYLYSDSNWITAKSTNTSNAKVYGSQNSGTANWIDLSYTSQCLRSSYGIQIADSPSYSRLIAANNDMYTSSSFTTVYFPKTTPIPQPMIEGLLNWKKVVLPQTQPGILPQALPSPDLDPDPEKITPFINPVQVPIGDIPIVIPPVLPPTPVVPVTNPAPSTSNDPVPKPNPNADPSQLPEIISPPEPVKLPEPANSGSTPEVFIPVAPSISSEATGLLHVYNPTNDQINEFGAWLWTTFSGDLIDTISKLFNNPMDAVIGLHELYSTPSTSVVTTIRAGYLDSGVASRLVSSRYTEIKCGALSVPEYWGNYLDYAPYTKSYCYLPFIGIVELNTDDIVGSGVEITYKIDSYNGSCIALITTAKAGSDESVSYEFAGNCAVEIPITSGMKSAVQGALIGAATMALAASTGGGAIAAAAMVGGARGAVSKNVVQHSGSFGSSYGAMGIKVPYLIIKRPKQKVVAGYNENYGYPAHKMVHIASCTGYLKAIEVDVVSPTATEDEKRLIEKQLKSGIFVD